MSARQLGSLGRARGYGVRPMSADEKSFERGLIVGLLGGVIGIAALLLAAAPTPQESLERCEDMVKSHAN